MELSRFRHFEIERLLGRGGMGEVYLAYDGNLERRIALKLLPRELLRDPAAQGRLLDEARSISRVQHPNIAVIHSIEEDGGVYALCMEYIEGLSLKELLHRKGPLQIPQILHLASQVAAGMQAAHEAGIVHRDLKPANVMVTAGGEAKVMDFGLALRPQRVVDTVGSSTYGTVQYMSPEQARGETLDARSDIFSFGSTLYELTTGHAPFQGANDLAILQNILNSDPPRLRDVRREVPPALEQFIRGCMAKPVGARWESMGAVLGELRYLTPAANAGPRDLISELSTNLTGREDELHKPRNHGAVGRRSASHAPPAGAQSGPTPPVPPEASVDFGEPLPEGVVIHEIVDRGIVEYGPGADTSSTAGSPSSETDGSEASAGLDIQTTSEQWQEIVSKSRRVDIIRREVASREQARIAETSVGDCDGFEEILAWEPNSEEKPGQTPPSDTPRPEPTATHGPRSGRADPFLGPDPQRPTSPSRSQVSRSGGSRWKLLFPMILAIALAAMGAWAILQTAGLKPGLGADAPDLESTPAEVSPSSSTRVPQEPPVSNTEETTAAASSDSLAMDSAGLADFGGLGLLSEMPTVTLPRPPRIVPQLLR
jgi:serine/threonine protein kinase